MSKLNFYKPARNWYEALPLGNGKTAMMVYGGIHNEKIFFNDVTLWSGYPHDYTNEKAKDALAITRNLIKNKKYVQAEEVVENKMNGNYSEAYMPLAILSIKIKGNSGLHNINRYKRSLDLSNGIMNIIDVVSSREVFASYLHNLSCYSIKSCKNITLNISAKSLLEYRVDIKDDLLVLSGFAPDYAAPHYLGKMKNDVHFFDKKAMGFVFAVKIKTDGKIINCDNNIKILNAKFVQIYSTTETGFQGFDKMPSRELDLIKENALKNLQVIDELDYEQIKQEHIKDFSKIFNSENFIVSNGDGNIKKLLKQARRGELNAELINLLYDYGKYLTISGSRKYQPLNLQGQWNAKLRAPWSSNYTININTQMNYWGASRANLQECLEPFYKAVMELIENGEKTAKINFGARGFVVNHNVDIWRMTTPVKGSPSYMYSPLCGAWLACEMYRHKKNSDKIDEDCIKAIEDAAYFILDYLYEIDEKLVVCPSVSPETMFSTKEGNASVGVASAFEMSIVLDVFKNCLESSNNENLMNEIKIALDKLAPFEEASNGLSEWIDGKESIEKGHRHFSPLYGIYPADIINENTKEYKWAKNLFYYRMKHSHSSIGWSAIWALCLASRFHDKEMVEKVLKRFMSKSIMNNLFDYHPPCYFQIDGNLGYLAAIHEMILREYVNGVIELLPALPSIINNGKVENLIVKGTKISFIWENGKVIKIDSDKKIEILDKNLDNNILINENVYIVKK